MTITAGRCQYGLLEAVAPNHPLCRRIQMGGLRVAVAQHLLPRNRDAVWVTCRIGTEYARNQLLQEVFYAWRLPMSCHPDVGYQVVISRYPDQQVRRTAELLLRAQRAGLLGAYAVEMRPSGWIVRALRDCASRRYFLGQWLELFALIVASRLVRARCPGLPEPLTRVVVADELGNAVRELDVVVPLPDGKLLIVEAKAGFNDEGDRQLSDAATRWRLKRSHAVLLQPGGRTRIHDQYIVMGPRAYVLHLRTVLTTP